MKNANPTDYFVPLIDVIRAREEHAAPYHLAHDTSHRPDVHVLLVSHTQNHLSGRWLDDETVEKLMVKGI